MRQAARQQAARREKVYWSWSCRIKQKKGEGSDLLPSPGNRAATCSPARAVPSAPAGLTAIAAPYAFGNRKTGTTSLIPPEASGQLVPLGFGIAAFAPAAYRRGSLPRPLLGNLISGTASRLDAFSAYPNRAWLPGYAPGGTTGAPEARPSRSSRTKDRPPQVSNARNR